MLDAYCLHLGANMGVGGTVEGEHIVCPWHGWQWRGDGTNALIPYSKIGCKQNVKIKSYPAQEWYGFIVVWHERHGRAPVLAAAGAARTGNRRVLPAAPALPDAQPGQGACADDHRERRRPVSRAVRPQGGQRRQHHVVRCERLPPARDGDRQFRRRPRVDVAHSGRPVDANIIYDNYSLGLGIVRFPKELVATIEVTGQTPVDEDYTDYFYTQASIREPGDTGDKPAGRAAKFLALQQEVIKQDFFTWENMKYLEKPNLAPEEARDYAALRRWAHRFYPGEEPSPIDFGYTANGEPDPAAAGA